MSDPVPDWRAAADQRRRPYRAACALARSGVLGRQQALGCGLSERQVDWLVASGRWARLFPGVYAVHTGPLSPIARVHAVLLHVGAGAVAGGMTALWLSGVLDDSPAVVTVCVPDGRRVRSGPGIKVIRRRSLDRLRHPAATVPRIRVEEAVLDVADGSTRVEDVVDVVVRAVQRRVTTAGRLRAALAARRRHRWRRLLGLVLEDVVVGVRSALEQAYLRAVERAHRLPPATYNRSEQATERAFGRQREVRRYRDVRYPDRALVIELDGGEVHPPEESHRDHRRDNAVTVAGGSSLRYGWREVAGDACGTAEDVARALRSRGWPGSPARCGPDCSLSAEIVEPSHSGL